MMGALLLLAVGLITVFGTAAPRFVQPGSLSVAHSQILEGTLTKDRCAACHGNVTADQWSGLAQLGHAGITGSLGNLEPRTMTDRCVTCHHERIPAKLARSAHNLSVVDRSTLTQRLHRQGNSGNPDRIVGMTTPDVAISQDDVGCSVCHREHHGAHANISAVTDSRCQTCHSRQFGSFATSHPEFDDYPPRSNRSIAFDHVRHASLHYPKESGGGSPIAFDCRSCHVMPVDSESDPIVRSLPFEVACASCHDEELKVQVAMGPALIALPTLPDDVARRIESWPTAATGLPDGKLSAWMRLLLAAQDPDLNFDGMTDLGLVDWDSPDRRDQAVYLGRAIRQFAIDLSIHGQPHLKNLAERAGADEATAIRLARSFQPQLLRDAVRDWFGKSDQALLGNRSRARNVRLVNFDDDVLTDWSKEPDPLLSSGPPTEKTSDWIDEIVRRYDSATAQSFGGWYRDDLTLSVRYRGTGHTDSVLRSLIELSRRSGTDLTDDPAIAACVKCHQGPNWNSLTTPGLRSRLTKFTHRPHLGVLALQDCRHCHDLNEPVAGSQAAVGFTNDFQALNKDACAHCHTSNAAGDRCTTCHRYHVGDVRSPQP